MFHNLAKLPRNFFRCGLAGWCMEICYTSATSLCKRDFRLRGITSLWMFPIYGSAAFLRPLFAHLKNHSVLVRGLTYMSLIFSTEYLSGRLLRSRGLCPWDYKGCRFQIDRLIRLDFAPLWFGAGLFFERLVTDKNK